MTKHKNTIILYSGGIDSTVLLHEYKDYIALALLFDYGAKASHTELHYAKLNCRKINIPYAVIQFDFIKKWFKSGLIDKNIPVNDKIVPFRNGIFISIASGIAESMMLENILIGSNKSDTAFDASAGFLNYMRGAVYAGTVNTIQLSAPYIKMTKHEVISNAVKLNIDLSDTWSCYEGVPVMGAFGALSEIHCGKCPACILRKDVLKGIDTTKYAL